MFGRPLGLHPCGCGSQKNEGENGESLVHGGGFYYRSERRLEQIT